MSNYSFPKEKVEIFLTEKIDQAAKKSFEEAGYKVTEISGALEGAELEKVIKTAHVLGVRSRSKIDATALKAARRLLSVGCYTVGTDQVDLPAARAVGVPVFNAPHSSTRSVAELTIACIIALSRKLGDQNTQMHQGRWEKSASGAIEVRDKAIGIIGYGHIGQQVGLLAEAIGLNVFFYDIEKKLPLGRAKSCPSLAELLRQVDFLSLHVPSTESTADLISATEMLTMKKGSFLINHSRGQVVNIGSLVANINSGQLGGAALDVYPSEPQSNSSEFVSELSGLPNVILTPHVGGSTKEAQSNIGSEVTKSLIEYLETGNTQGAVNFPNVNLPAVHLSHRILHIHKNVPGVLSEVNRIVSEVGANIDAQSLSTSADIGYLIMDVNKELSEEVKNRIALLPQTIKARILF